MKRATSFSGPKKISWQRRVLSHFSSNHPFLLQPPMAPNAEVRAEIDWQLFSTSGITFQPIFFYFHVPGKIFLVPNAPVRIRLKKSGFLLHE